MRHGRAKSDLVRHPCRRQPTGVSAAIQPLPERFFEYSPGPNDGFAERLVERERVALAVESSAALLAAMWHRIEQKSRQPATGGNSLSPESYEKSFCEVVAFNLGSVVVAVRSG